MFWKPIATLSIAFNRIRAYSVRNFSNLSHIYFDFLFPSVLATSGIDYDIKLWAPLESEPVDRSDEIADLIERNKLMLEETRDTVTIPAAFMLRMIAAMNRYRRGIFSVFFFHSIPLIEFLFLERRQGESDDDDSDSP